MQILSCKRAENHLVCQKKQKSASSTGEKCVVAALKSFTLMREVGGGGLTREKKKLTFI